MNIKKLRKKENITQMELASKVGVSLTTIRNWEHGASTPNKENMKRLKKVLKEN